MPEKKIKPPGTDCEVWVDTDGYLFGRECIELVRFIPDKKYARAADLGSGDGIIPVYAAKTRKIDEICAIELANDCVRRTLKTVDENKLTGRIQVLHSDIRKLQAIFRRRSFDLVTANPPFFEKDRDFHSISAKEKAARQEETGKLTHFLNAARYLLKKTGDLIILYHPRRIDQLFLELHRAEFTLKELKLLYHSDGRALFLLARAVPAGKPGVIVHPPVTLPDSFKGEVMHQNSELSTP